MISSFRTRSARLCAVLAFGACLLAPSPARARGIVELSSSPTFPADAAFAGRSLYLPLASNLPSVEGTRSFSVSLGGVQFDFATSAFDGFHQGYACDGCNLFSQLADITLT